jgi:hypothetical protein
MKKNSSQKKQENKLKKDLKRLVEHWEALLKKQVLRKDKAFLKKIAKDIQQLDKDVSLSKEIPDLYPASYLIHHFLISPYGAAFLTNRSLLDAALAFESQVSDESDLSQLLEEPKEQLPMLFWSLYEIVKKEKE